MKYIKNVKPYDYSKLLLNLNNKSEILKEYYKFNKNKNKTAFNSTKKRKEKIIDLSLKSKKNKNFYFSRMVNIDQEKVINSRKEKIFLYKNMCEAFY